MATPLQNVYRDSADQSLETIRAAARDYADADPFPHCVLRGLFDDEFLDEVAAEFPDAPSMDGQFDDARQKKSAEARWSRFGPATRRLIAELNSGPFVDALEVLTSVPSIITDHHLLGGGQHQITAGGMLGVHADFNRHRQLRLDRRLNLLLYLNHDWDDAWGGHLELWDTSMSTMVRRVRPDFNTMVVFSTTSDSYHGHPEPLATPPGVTRRSIAIYYYTNGRDDGHGGTDHSTLFRDKPSDVSAVGRQRRALGHFKVGARLLLPESPRRRGR